MSEEPSLQDLLPITPEPLPPAPKGMLRYTMYRSNDESGVSGTGIVGQGVLFANGIVAHQWLCPPDPGDVQIKKDWERFLDTHVRSHLANGTIITFENGKQLRFFEETEKNNDVPE